MIRDIATDPQPGDEAGGWDKTARKVSVRFTDATGQECIHYTETHVITVKSWTSWFKRTGATRLP